MGLNARPVLNGLVVAEIARDLQELQQKAVSLVSSAWFLQVVTKHTTSRKKNNQLSGTQTHNPLCVSELSRLKFNPVQVHGLRPQEAED